MNHHKYMLEAISIAKSNIGKTFPNPSVGCVITKNGKIIAKSVTAFGGRPHAEAIALSSSKNFCGSTIYITLEPCSHYGKTPPCIDLIIKHKIEKIFVAILDQDSRMRGKSIEKLRKAGIIVEIGLCQEEALEIYKPYFKHRIFNQPFVTLKIASSIDGKIALSNGDSKWITNKLSREYVHNIRAQNDAILVGINTIIKDNPNLNCRIEKLSDFSPIIFIIDRDFKIEKDRNIINNSSICYIICDKKFQYSEKTKIFEELGVKFMFLELIEKYFDFNKILSMIGDLGITSLLVEGGAKIFTQLIKNKLFDQLIWIQSNLIIGNDGLSSIGDFDLDFLSQAMRLKMKNYSFINDDLVRIFYHDFEQAN